MKHVALLRGVNVGGKNRLPMKALAALLEELGCSAVTTYIQSGNVVYEPPPKGAERLAAALSKRLESDFGLRVPVLTRSAAELASIAENNPFLARGADPDTLHVAFLAATPPAAAVAALDPDRSPGDAFEVRGREIYLCLPNGAARTKLTNDWFDRALETVSSGRNWRTVLKLVEMSG